MNKMAKCTTIGIFTAVAGQAGAGIYHANDPSIFSPFNNAQVDVIWVSSDAGYTGELQWVDTTFESGPQTLWTNKNATPSQTYRVPRLFAAGERVDFRYEVTKGRIDAYATYEPGDWGQFAVDASNPLDVMVGVEDIRYPRGDMDLNDAVFRVVFSESVIPSPGSLALLGAGGLFLARRRR